MYWQYGAATHTGWFRTLNEDRSLLRMGTSGGGTPYAAAVLADGMGGTEDGGLASETAVQMVKEWLDARLPGLWDAPNLWNAMERELRGLFLAIHIKLKANGSRLGTTLTILLLSGGSYFVAHIGDCRVMHVRDDGRYRLLSRDHTWVRTRRIPSSKAVRHPKRHVLTQSLGMQGMPSVYFRSGVYMPGSLFLLSSDGFHGCFTTRAIAAMLQKELQQEGDLQQACDRLMARALWRQAGDNISLLSIRPMGEIPPRKELVRLYLQHGLRRLKKIHTLIPVFGRK